MKGQLAYLLHFGLNNPVVTANTSPMALTAVDPTRNSKTDPSRLNPQILNPLKISTNPTNTEYDTR
ncbi:MAG: hypothetical protein ACI9KK_000537 [Ascidiaceihabitans sp.]|jgi:hypothetical protein